MTKKEQISDGDYVRAMKGEENVFGTVREIAKRNNRLEQIATRLDDLDKKTIEDCGGYIP